MAKNLKVTIDSVNVVLLLRHKENDIVKTSHLLVCQCIDLLNEIRCPRDVRPISAESLHMLLIMIDKVDLTAFLAYECAQNGSQ